MESRQPLSTLHVTSCSQGSVRCSELMYHKQDPISRLSDSGSTSPTTRRWHQSRYKLSRRMWTERSSQDSLWRSPTWTKKSPKIQVYLDHSGKNIQISWRYILWLEPMEQYTPGSSADDLMSRILHLWEDSKSRKKSRVVQEWGGSRQCWRSSSF